MLTASGAVPLSRTLLSAGGRSAELLLPSGVALSREVFDHTLVRAAIDSGAAFVSGTTARLLPDTNSERRQLRLTQGNQETLASARSVIAADGLGGRLLARESGHRVRIGRAARIGAGTVLDIPNHFYRPGIIYMACGKMGYVGMVRREDGLLDVAAALDP